MVRTCLNAAAFCRSCAFRLPLHCRQLSDSTDTPGGRRPRAGHRRTGNTHLRLYACGIVTLGSPLGRQMAPPDVRFVRNRTRSFWNVTTLNITSRIDLSTSYLIRTRHQRLSSFNCLYTKSDCGSDCYWQRAGWFVEEAEMSRNWQMRKCWSITADSWFGETGFQADDDHIITALIFISIPSSHSSHTHNITTNPWPEGLEIKTKKMNLSWKSGHRRFVCIFTFF